MLELEEYQFTAGMKILQHSRSLQGTFQLRAGGGCVAGPVGGDEASLVPRRGLAGRGLAGWRGRLVHLEYTYFG